MNGNGWADTGFQVWLCPVIAVPGSGKQRLRGERHGEHTHVPRSIPFVLGEKPIRIDKSNIKVPLPRTNSHL
jgi:hypothetical protein